LNPLLLGDVSPDGADDALGKEYHHEDEQDTEEQQPPLHDRMQELGPREGLLRQVLQVRQEGLSDQDEGDSHDAAVKCPHAADDDHEQDIEHDGHDREPVKITARAGPASAASRGLTISFMRGVSREFLSPGRSMVMRQISSPSRTMSFR